VAPVLAGHDALLFPTAPTHPTLAAVAAAPIARNAELGTYTNFVNLLDLSAIAIPAERRDDGLPFGVTLMAPAGGDERLLALARRVMDHVADLPALRADHREAPVLDDRVEARVPEHL
jgi:allophanate hydrolase